MIIVPDDQSFVTYNYFSPPAPAAAMTFGPVFKKDFLARVLELQNNVVSLQASDNNQTISLSDICLKPLEPDNKNCTVFSILQYYQNSLDNLQKVVADDFGEILADFATHFYTCAQAPTTTNDTFGLGITCFGDFGGTINPFMVLGNYSNTAYSNATALVITIVIENSNDPEKIRIGSLG